MADDIVTRLDELNAIIYELAGEVAPGGPEDRAWAAINDIRSTIERLRSEQVGEPKPEDTPSVVIGYTNWRGEYGKRAIIPMHPWFGSTDWHPEPQWLLKAWDVAKGAERDFAIKDIGFHPTPAPDAEPAEGVTDAGWVMVPREPTEEMIVAGHRQIDWCRNDQKTHRPGHPSQKPMGVGTDCGEDIQDAYKAMLAAAPAPDAEPAEGVTDAAQFLLDRLDDLWNSWDDEEAANEFNGHVLPAMGRLRWTLAALRSKAPSGEGE